MKHLFISKKIDDTLRQKGAEYGYYFHDFELLKIKPLYSDEIKNYLLSLSKDEIHVVISSQHTVQSLKVIFHTSIPPQKWKIYTINQATANGIAEWYGHENNICAKEKDIRSLLNHLPTTSKIFHICGNHTRPELPEFCKEHSISLEQIIVYESIKNQVTLSDVYDAYFFCSPRSVSIFFERNTIPSAALSVAIGASTAETLEKFTSNIILQSEQPTLIDMLKTYYHYDQKRLTT